MEAITRMSVVEMLFAGFISIRQKIFDNAEKGNATPEIFDMLLRLQESIIAAHGFEFDMDALPLMFEGWMERSDRGNA